MKCKSTFLWLRKISFLIATQVIENRSCPREDGFCIKQDGRDQNSRVKKLNSFDGKAIERQEQCVELCKRENEATGCEVIWGQGNRGCYVHKAEIARGNGGDRHYCCVFLLLLVLMLLLHSSVYLLRLRLLVMVPT